MKKLTIVTYRAFDMEHTETFINKSDEEIKAKLNDTCSTFTVLKTYYAEVLSEHDRGFKSDFNPKALPGYLQTENTLEKL